MKQNKIVIADDDEILRYLLKKLLLQNGFKVVGEAVNGAEARKMCDRYQPDALMLDINMPKVDGFEALKQIRTEHPSMKVFMISSDATMKNVQEAGKYRVDGFIVKPFTASKVIEALNKSLA